MQRQRSRIFDMFYLIGAALLVCVFGVGAFVVANIYHISPLWVFFGLEVRIGHFGVSECNGLITAVLV